MQNKKIVHGSRKQEKAQINWTTDYWNSECCDDNMVPMIGNRRNLHQSSYRRIKGFVSWKILRAARKNNGANLGGTGSLELAKIHGRKSQPKDMKMQGKNFGSPPSKKFMKLWENAHRMLGNGEHSTRLPGNSSPIGIRPSASDKNACMNVEPLS